MKVKILAFGIAREIFGASVLQAELNVPNTTALKAKLEEDYPRLRQLASYLVAVNRTYAAEGSPLAESDEIAIIPPVSGG